LFPGTAGKTSFAFPPPVHKTVEVNDRTTNPGTISVASHHPEKRDYGTRLPKSIFGALVLAAIAQSVSSFPHLPNRVASHFGPSGAPNGWMSKQSFFIIYALMIVLAAFIQVFPARSIRRPSARINLPHKEYWLAPERHAETFGYFEKYFAWYGCVFLLVMVLIMGLAIQANLNPPPHLPNNATLGIMVAFLAYNIASVIHIFRRFAKIR
jgi:uncharacterized membrane protein